MTDSQISTSFWRDSAGLLDWRSSEDVINKRAAPVTVSGALGHGRHQLLPRRVHRFDDIIGAHSSVTPILPNCSSKQCQWSGLDWIDED